MSTQELNEVLATERKIMANHEAILKQHNEIMASIARIAEQSTQSSETVPRMLTIKAAADLTGLSYDHLRKLCLQNKITYVKAGKKFLINAAKMVQFLEKGEIA